MKTTKLDLFRVHGAEYVAPKKPVFVKIAPARYLAAAGTGAPGGAAFEAAIGALFAMAFTIKMRRKLAGGEDYAVAKLECQYLMEPGEFESRPKEDWSWRLLIRTPEFIRKSDLVAARKALQERGREAGTDGVNLETLKEGRCVQVLHVGPYDQEGKTVAGMAAFAAASGCRLAGPHHEIYLSDPRRVAPERLRTLLRVPVVAG